MCCRKWHGVGTMPSNCEELLMYLRIFFEAIKFDNDHTRCYILWNTTWLLDSPPPPRGMDLLYDIQTTVPGQWHCSLPVSATSLKHVSLWLSSLWCFVSIIPKLTQLSWTIDGERDYNPTAVKFLSDPARNFHCLQKIQAQNPQFLPEVNKSVCLTLPLSFRITS